MVMSRQQSGLRLSALPLRLGYPERKKITGRILHTYSEEKLEIYIFHNTPYRQLREIGIHANAGTMTLIKYLNGSKEVYRK